MNTSYFLETLTHDRYETYLAEASAHRLAKQLRKPRRGGRAWRQAHLRLRAA